MSSIKKINFFNYDCMKFILKNFLKFFLELFLIHKLLKETIEKL